MSDVAIVEGQSHKRAHHLPALYASCARIDHEAAQRAIGHDFENVAMAAYKEFGP